MDIKELIIGLIRFNYLTGYKIQDKNILKILAKIEVIRNELYKIRESKELNKKQKQAIQEAIDILDDKVLYECEEELKIEELDGIQNK